MDQEDANTSNSSSSRAAMVTVKAVYCPGSAQEEIRRFNFPVPGADSQQPDGLYDELRRHIGSVCTAGGSGSGESLSLYYVDSDQERIRFSTSDELAQLLRLHHQSQDASAPSVSTTLRILAEPATSSDADGVEHPGVRCDGCNQSVVGRRFRCFVCPDYDLCQRCVLRGVHDQHSMLVLHRPGDADSLPPWLSRVGAGGPGAGVGGPGPGFGRGGAFGRGGFGWMWGGGRHFPWQQQQQQPPQMSQGCPPFARPPPPFGGCGTPPMMPPPPPPPPLSVACPKLAKKLEKARSRFEAKMAKRCDRLQRKWAYKQQCQQQQQQCQQQQQQQREDSASVSGTADEPIRIDIDEQQLQKQKLTPEEALLLKQLKKRSRQSSAAKKKLLKHHRHHHKRGHGGRKRRRSRSSSSSSSGSSGSSDGASSSSGSDSDSGSDAGSAEQKGYRQLLKKFRKMGFKDDETCWLRELIREKRGNLNDILDVIRQRKEAGRDV